MNEEKAKVLEIYGEEKCFNDRLNIYTVKVDCLYQEFGKVKRGILNYTLKGYLQVLGTKK